MNTGVKIGIGAVVGAIFGLPVAYQAYKRMHQDAVLKAQNPQDITDANVCKELGKYWYYNRCNIKPY